MATNIIAGVSSVIGERQKGWKVVQKSLPRIVDYGRNEGILQIREYQRGNAVSNIPGIVIAAQEGLEAHQQAKENKGGDKVNLPTNDITLMHEAIPFLPFPIALVCLFLNVVLPGSGTILSGAAALCMGQPRVNIKEGRKLVTLLVNLLVGVSQFFTITFLFVGWFWSIAWGGLIIIHAMQYREALQQRRQEAVATAAIEALTKDSILHRRDVKTLVRQHKDKGKEDKERAKGAGENAPNANGMTGTQLSKDGGTATSMDATLQRDKTMLLSFWGFLRPGWKTHFALVGTVSCRAFNSFSLRTHNCGELRLHDVGSRVKLYGWLAYKRMNKFVVLRDSFGSVQAVLPRTFTSLIKSTNVESALCLEGVVADRGKERNAEMATGDIEIIVDRFEVLGPCDPVLPVQGSSNEHTRLSHRYFDLRSERMQRALRLRAKVISRLRRFLEDRCGFVDVQTPTLAHTTPGGAAEFPVPANKSGECFSLPQSPQIYKQLLMCGSVDRYYQVAICYRDEAAKSDRQPEFTQLDMELSFTSQEMILSLIEQLIVASWPDEIVPKPTVPFPRVSYREAMERFGTDKPDIGDKGMAHRFDFAWVLNFPLFTRNETTNCWESSHHPFTAPIPEHLEQLRQGKDLGQIEAQHYDLVLNGVEIGGGSIRIHNAELQRFVMEHILNLRTDELEHFLTALRYGAPPHGGFALGLDRFVALLNSGGETKCTIRDVMAFPKTSSGRCPMTNSPTPPSKELLKRYGLNVDAEQQRE
uniref:Aminoacyl-transfer RNA synthetases class-II family profile domain-containing protein n=1 Tax=Globodera rostochiensis TaxID=31243 RepID=A0A914HJ47_GLORO